MYNTLFFGPGADIKIFMIVVAAVWDLVWRGLALWRAARATQKGWFLALLVVSSLGILPIIYLAIFQKKSKSR